MSSILHLAASGGMFAFLAAAAVGIRNYARTQYITRFWAWFAFAAVSGAIWSASLALNDHTMVQLMNPEVQRVTALATWVGMTIAVADSGDIEVLQEVV